MIFFSRGEKYQDKDKKICQYKVNCQCKGMYGLYER